MSGTDRYAFTEETRCQSFFVLPFAVGFVTLGGISVWYARDQPQWDNLSWYQNYISAFVASVGLMLIFVTLIWLSVEAKNQAKPFDLQAKRMFLKWSLLSGFVGILGSAVILGNFIKESNVFNGCDYDKNKVYFYNSTSMNCFHKYDLIRGLAALDVISLILSLIFIFVELGDHKRNKKMILSSNDVYKNAKTILFTMLIRKESKRFILCIQIGTFFAIGGFATWTLNTEEDGIQSFKLYVSAFIGGGMSLIVFVLYCIIQAQRLKGNHESVKRVLNWVPIFLLIAIAAFIGSLATVGSFIEIHSDFVKCPNSTLYENDTILFTCFEHNDSLKSCSIASIVLLIVSFFVMVSIFRSHTCSKTSENSEVGNVLNKQDSFEPKADSQKTNESKKENNAHTNENEARRNQSTANERTFKHVGTTNSDGPDIKQNSRQMTTITLEKEQDKDKKNNIQRNNTELSLKIDFENETKKKTTGISVANVIAKLGKQKQEENEHNPIHGAWVEDKVTNKETDKIGEKPYENIPSEDFRYESPTRKELTVRASTLYNDYGHGHTNILPPPPPPENPDDFEVNSMSTQRSLPLPPAYSDVVDEDKI